jgi:hypothetical protein
LINLNLSDFENEVINIDRTKTLDKMKIQTGMILVSFWEMNADTAREINPVNEMNIVNRRSELLILPDLNILITVRETSIM